MARYEPLMRAFLASRFPTVPADDIMQETLIALVDAMPTYRYSPRVEYICKGNAYNGKKLEAFRADFSPAKIHGQSFYSLGFRLVR